MKFRKFPPLALAAVLQLLPFARLFTSGEPVCGCNFAVLSRWMAGGMALLGAYDTVSGASVSINSPTTAKGTNGLTFSYRITTTTTYGGMNYSAAPLPPGLALSGPFIRGIPTNSGVFSVTLIVSETGRPTLVGPLTITIVDSANLPKITTQPTNQVVAQGGNVTFNVAATGPPPLSYQWLFNGLKIMGATTNSYTLSNVLTNNAGSYWVVVTNLTGRVASSYATLTVTPAISPPLMLQASVLGGQFMLSFDAVTGQNYAVEYNATLASNSWSPLTNILAVATNSTFIDSTTNASQRFYRISTTAN